MPHNTPMNLAVIHWPVEFSCGKFRRSAKKIAQNVWVDIYSLRFFFFRSRAQTLRIPGWLGDRVKNRVEDYFNVAIFR